MTALAFGIGLFVAIALSLVLFALLARAEKRRFEKLGPRALADEFERQREARR